MNQSCQTEKERETKPLNLPDTSLVAIFFHHPVYKNAGQLAQKTLSRVFLQKQFTIKFEESLFELKQGKVQSCRKRIQNKYYQCQDCQLQDNACLCEDCFDFEKHKTHNFAVKHNCGYCDCGIIYRWKPQGFCDCHGPHIKKQVQVDEESHKKFIEFFKDCFTIYFELVFQSISDSDKKNQSLQEMIKGSKLYISAIINELNRINTKSPYYNQLTSEVLKIEIQAKNKNGQKIKAPILVHLMTRQYKYLPRNFSDLIVCLSHNDEILKLFYKTCYQEHSESQVNNFRAFQNVLFETSDYIHIYNQLADDGVLTFYKKDNIQSIKNMITYYINILTRIHGKFYKKQSGKLLSCWRRIYEMGLMRADFVQEKQLLKIVQDCTADAHLCQQILSIYIQYMLKNIDEFDKTENARIQRVQKISTQLDNIIKNIAQICGPYSDKIAQKLIQLCKNSSTLEKIFKEFLQQTFNSPNKASKITLKAVAQAVKILNSEDKADKTGFIQKIVDNLANLNFNSLKKFLPNFLNQAVLESAKQVWMKYLFAKDSKQKENFCFRAQTWLKKFLCMHKKVSLLVIRKFKEDKLLDFQGAGDILDQYTTYDNSQRQFIYKDQLQNFEDYFVFSFDDMISRQSTISLVFNPQVVDQRFRDPENDKKEMKNNNNQCVLQELLKPLLERFEKDGINIFSSIQNDQDSHKLIKACIIIDKIMDGKIQYLQDQLKEIENIVNAGQLPLFVNQFVKKNEKQEENIQNQEGQKSENMTEEKVVTPKRQLQQRKIEQGQNKEMTQQKKKKLKAKMEKFKQKFGKTREKHLIETPSKESPEKLQKNKQEEICCIVCKDPKESNNRMFYLAQTKTQKLLDSFFKKTLACDQIFETCLHPMHEKCFIQFIGSNSSKNCPLCNRQRNCILPFTNNVQKKGEEEQQQQYDNEIWRNRIIYVSIREHGNYNVPETALMLLKGVVTRNGIMEILQPQTKDFEFLTNSHIFKVMKDSYEQMDQRQRRKVQKKFIKMVELTQKNPNIGVGLIEELLLKAYWGEVSETINRKQNIEEIGFLLQKLQKCLNPIQFNLIRKQIEQLKTQKYLLNQEEQNNSQLVNNPPIFDLKPPSSAQQMLKLRCFCKKCNSIRGWYCLICKITYCYECDMINEHRNEIHKGNCIIIPLISGNLKTMSKEEGSEDFTIYRNKFKEEWGSSSKNTSEYKLDDERYKFALNKWLKSN